MLYLATIELIDEERAYSERVEASTDAEAIAEAKDIAANCGENARVMSIREKSTMRFLDVEPSPIMQYEEHDNFTRCHCEDYPCCGH